jgi:predicted permease
MLYFNWKFLTPLAIIVLVVTAISHKILSAYATLPYIVGMFLINVIVAWITIEILRRYSRAQREAVSGVAQPALENAQH